MNRRFSIYKWILVGIMFILGACEEMLAPVKPASSPQVVFEHLWNDINNRYSFFEEKQVDWHAIREKYSSKIFTTMSEHELFDVLGDMLGELEDGHVNLLSTFDRSRNWLWYENFPLFYNQQLIEQVYLRTNFWIIGPLQVQTLDDDVLYVNYRSFERPLTEQHMDQIVFLMRSHKGLIIDVRSNGGGNLQNALTIMSRFIEEEHLYGQQRFKSGPGRNDFTPWAPLRIIPSSGSKYLGNVAILTNRRSYSTTTFFAQMGKTLPQVRLFGDQTGGGGGIPVFAELPNGWTYRFSASQSIDLEENHLEFGVQVDEDLTSFLLVRIGRDHFIDTAVSWLKEQSE